MVDVPKARSCWDARYQCGNLTFSRGQIFVADTSSGLDVMAGRGSLAQNADKAAVDADAARQTSAKSKLAF